ncbi:MAG: hypothetical protein ACO1OB_25930 [Archangium sp.]
MDHNGSSFLTCAVASTGFIYFAKELDVLSKRGTPNSAFFVFKEKDTEAPFRKFDENVHWPAISMATVKPEGGARVVVAIGHNGDFWELAPATTVETLGVIPNAGVLRQVNAIGDRIFACGMNRVVLERTGVGAWKSVGPVVDEAGIVGFEAVAGFDENELYAAGWNGELWWRDAGTWRRVESGTTVNLKSLTCADGFVYAVGDEGVLLQGRRDSWTKFASGTTEDLRDVAVRDGVHVLSSSKVSGIDGENFLRIFAASDGLVVLSRKQIYVRRDGSFLPIVH